MSVLRSERASPDKFRRLRCFEEIIVPEFDFGDVINHVCVFSFDELQVSVCFFKKLPHHTSSLLWLVKNSGA